MTENLNEETTCCCEGGCHCGDDCQCGDNCQCGDDCTCSECHPQEVVKENKPLFTIRQMLESGVHFGHKTMRWNAKMAPYIYGTRNNLHIIDLTQTAILMNESMRILREIAKKRGKILFVCTKKQGAEIVAKMAQECDQYYVNHKWLGGMLTNWKTISQSIKKIKAIENQLESKEEYLVKKERLKLQKDKEKLELNFNGIKAIGGRPDLVFVIDTLKESLAVSEARSLGIPVMAIADTNVNPDVIDYIIPGNDDSIKAIELYCNIIKDTLQGVSLPKMEPKKFNNNKNSQSQKKSKFFGSKERKPFKKREETQI